MKPAVTILLLFNLLVVRVFAFQTHKLSDTFKKNTAQARLNMPENADTATINKLIRMADDNYESNPDSTFYYGSRAIALAKKINYRKGLADGYAQIASVYTFNGNYATAAANYSKALALYRQSHYLYGCSDAYIGLGSAADYLGNYKKAIAYYDSALTIRKQSGSKAHLAECYNIIGITHDNRGEYAQALDCYFKALSISLEHKNELSAADNYCNIGVVMQHLELYPKAISYAQTALDIWTRLKDRQGISTAWLNIGEALMAQKNFTEAIKYFNKAGHIFYDMNDQEGLSLLYYDLGLYKYYTRQPDSAVNYLQRSLQLASQHKIKYNKANAYLGLAQVYNLEKNYRQAYNYALQCQNVAGNIGTLTFKAEAALQLSIALAGAGNFSQAYRQHVLYNQLKDSLKKDESVQELISYNLEVDFKKKQTQIRDSELKQDAQLKQKIAQQRQTNTIAIVIIFGLVIMVVIYYRGKRKQLHINKLLAQSNREVLLQKANLDKQAENLNQLNSLKDRLIAILAHDLRAPLSTLKGLFALMTDESITHAELLAMVPQVVSKLHHTSDFLDTLLHWVNSQVDGSLGNIRVFNLDEVVDTELIYLCELTEQKKISTVVDIPARLPAYADASSVRIVVHNILTNAIKFSGRNTTIHIKGRRNGDRTVLTVTDEGMGMPPEQLNSLFKSKVNSFPGTENEAGTGMGLFFCKDLIEKYDGIIWAESTLGKGTLLGFSLPCQA